MMSDYLANLVARNLEVADRIEPRIASSFEPATGLQTRRSPFQDSPVPDPIEQDVFVERSPDGQTTTTSLAPRTPASGPPLGAAESVRDRVAAPAPAARAQPSLQGNIKPTSRRGSEVEMTPESSSRPSRPGTESTNASPMVAPAATDNRRVDHAAPSRPVPAGSAGVSPPARSGPSALTSRPQNTAGRRPEVPPAQARESAPLDVTVMVSPDTTIAAPAQRPNTAVTVDVAGAPGTTVSNPASGAETRSREERSPARSAIAGPSQSRISEPSRHGAESSFAAQSVHPEATPSAVAVQVRLRPKTLTDAPADRGIDDTAGTSASVPAAATIHVTIGRLEVKATPAQPAARTRPSSPAAASLEDYLRTRADGSGR
jgi:hypothetical protein